MPSSKVLLTGSTGYVGFRILIQALGAGYTVTAAVRSIPKAETKLLSTPTLSSSPDLVSRLTFVEVPNILTPGAYADAFKATNFDYVIHVASPIPNASMTDYQEEIIEPARNGTLEILRAALIAPSVKRIVVTSSMAANAFSPDGSVILSANAHSRLPIPDPPYPTLPQAYQASKVVALTVAEDFVKQSNPHWDLITIHPGYIIGYNELATTKSEFLTGTANIGIRAYIDVGFPMTEGFASVKDVARVHVEALNKNKIPGSRGYIVNSSRDWNDAWPVLEKDFPKEVEAGVFKQDPITDLPAEYDGRETEKLFGWKFTSFEECIRESARQWIQLVESDKT